MKWFNDLKTGRKLALGFGLCLLLAVVNVVVAVTRMAGMYKVSQNILSDSLAGVEALGKVQSGARQFRTVQYRHVLSFSKSDMDSAEADLTKAQGDTDAALKDYGKALADPTDKQNFSALKDDWQAYAATKDQVLALSHKNDTKGCAALMNGPAKAQFRKFTDALDTMVAWNDKHGQDYSRQVEAAYTGARNLMIGLLIAALAFGTLTAISITRYMTGALSQLSGRLEKLNGLCVTNFQGAIQAMERGDLTAQIVTGTEPLALDSKDEFGHLARTFNTMLDKVKDTIGSFRNSQAALVALVHELQASATQVSAASQTLSSGAHQVGAASEEITATMAEVSQASDQSARGASEIARGSASQSAALAQGSELVKELAQAVRSVARDAGEATRSAEQATEVATRGGQAVAQTVAGMGRIRGTVEESARVVRSLGEASARIGGIVQSIEEIADQTNLLALNAAIEAARAGEAGRGFAVVADEVRKLAERSRVATQEIGGLIGDVQSQTERAVAAMEAGTKEAGEGAALAEEAGGSLLQIQEVVAQVGRQVTSITAAAEEMLASSEEVSRSITEVAAVVEEASAAAEEMSASAEQVSASVQTVTGTVTQQGAAVEEFSASAEELAGVARSLEAATAKFTVDDTPRAAERTQLVLKKVA